MNPSFIIIALFVAATAFAADNPARGLNRLPVKEVSVFKDGHAFLVREGKLPAQQNGEVILDDVPAPVMGTFWAYSADKNLKLSSVVAGMHRTIVDRTALTVRALIEGNPN